MYIKVTYMQLCKYKMSFKNIQFKQQNISFPWDRFFIAKNCSTCKGNLIKGNTLTCAVDLVHTLSQNV